MPPVKVHAPEDCGLGMGHAPLTRVQTQIPSIREYLGEATPGVAVHLETLNLDALYHSRGA